MSDRTKVKLLTVLNGTMSRARRLHRLPVNPMADIEKPRHRRSTAIEGFSPEGLFALVRVADSEQDAAIYLTAAFTRLRCRELVALRWRDVDFAAHRIRVGDPRAHVLPLESKRGGTLAYLAACDVHHGRLFGRCEPKTGIEPFGRLVEQVMNT